MDRHKTLLITSEPIDRAANAGRSTVEDVSVYHRRLDVVMAQKLLYRSDIVTAFEQVSCEGMPESMACGPLKQSSLHNGIFDGQIGQEGVDFRLGHLGWVAHIVKIDEPLNPQAIGGLCPAAVMARAHGLPQKIEEFRFIVSLLRRGNGTDCRCK